METPPVARRNAAQDFVHEISGAVIAPGQIETTIADPLRQRRHAGAHQVRRRTLGCPPSPHAAPGESVDHTRSISQLPARQGATPGPFAERNSSASEAFFRT